MNEYIGRTQYALRSGKPCADVLIYFPYMDVDGMPDNPEEILTKGYIEGVEPPLPALKMRAGAQKVAAEKTEWANKIYPAINQLEANGITWDWVNDSSIQEAKLEGDKQIKYTFTRQAQREMSDGSRVQFIWNKSDAWQPLSLTLDRKYKNACWLNAETGTITAVVDIKNASFAIPPYSSIIPFSVGSTV